MTPPRICFVNPRIPPAAMNFAFAMDLVGCAFSHIPLPLATLAALTPPGLPVSIVDENVEPVPLDLDADVIAMTGIYCQRRRLFELADHFRARGRRVVIGGPIAVDLPDECRAHADVLFFGEAEYTWPRFCADLTRGEPAAEYRQDEWIDMVDSPIPRFELLKANRYSSACIQATRGCPYRCEFCDIPSKQGGRPRSKPVAQVLEEVRRLAALGFDSIFFVDDHFVGDRRYARELLTALAALLPTLPSAMYFYTQVTLNIARDPETLALFHAASFRRFFIGVETPDVAKLRAMDKHHNTEMDVRTAIETIQSYNITVWAGIIVGLDGDDARALEDQYRFISESCLNPTLIGILQAMPGAPLYDRIRGASRLRSLPDVVASGALGELTAQGDSNIVPDGMAPSELLRNYGELVRKLFDPDAFSARLLGATRRGRRAAPSVRGLVSWKNAKITARTVSYYLGSDEPRVRAMLFRVLGAAVRRRGRGLEELLYHLVIYKHLRTFYGSAAEIATGAAA